MPRTIHSTVHKTAMFVLAATFVFGSAVAFADSAATNSADSTENTTNEASVPLMLQMQSEQPASTAQFETPFQHYDVLSGEERANTFMFNGITLNERQRQQLRDLMVTQRHHHVDNTALVQEREALRKLIIADSFDDQAVREQLEKHMQKELDQRVEMARIHHELYQLLTPEQKAQLEQVHQHKMTQYQVMQ